MKLDENTVITLTPKTTMSCSTNGKGLWSVDTRSVPITKIVLEVGELSAHFYDFSLYLPVYVNAYFTKKDWNTDKHGLIYTDALWLKDFKKQFAKQFPSLAWAANKIDYTEQGMQGDNYVSLEFVLESMPSIKKFCDGVDRIKNKKIKPNRDCLDLPVYVDGVEVR